MMKRDTEGALISVKDRSPSAKEEPIFISPQAFQTILYSHE
jgi:hypothetical protein